MSIISTLLRSSSVHRNFRKTTNLTYSVWKKCARDLQNGDRRGSCQRVLVNFRCAPTIHGAHLHARYLTTSANKRKEPSSKIEETVERLKEKQTVVPKEPAAVEVKKSMWVRFKDECTHYYSGFKLLFLDVQVSSKIVWKILRGKTLSRRESRQLVRTTSDLFRLVPFSVFIIVPFMELLLPVALKLFPGMLPSTFTTSSQRDEKLKKSLQAKLEYTRFLQKTLDEMNPKGSGRSSRSAADFVGFYNEVKQSSGILDNDRIMKFAKLFEDDITLDNMDRTQLSAICRLLNLTPIGTSNFLRLQIEMRLRHLKADDRLIQKEGMDRMSHVELQNANVERGMPAFGLSEERLKAQLAEWIDLSLNYKVPPSLLLLSRTLYNIDNLAPTQKIASAISALPEKAASATSASIGEREGKIRNVVRLEQIREEQRKIEAEAQEQAKLEASKQKHKDATESQKTPASEVQQAKLVESISPITKATVTEGGELIHDKAPILVDKAPEMEPTKQTEVLEESKTSKKVEAEPVSIDSLSELKSAIESLGIAPSEQETLKEIKKELEEYDEDVRELDEVKNLVSRLDLRESLAAKLLFGRVNKMLRKSDALVTNLQKKKTQISQDLKEFEGEELQEQKDQIVTIQEIIEAVTTLQKSPNQAKVDQIAQVLSMIDADADGVIKVDHVLKVIELLGVENAELSAKQIKQIINVLSEEEKLMLEDSIEHILVKKPQKKDEVDEAAEKEIEALEKASKQGKSDQETKPNKNLHIGRNGENH